MSGRYEPQQARELSRLLKLKKPTQLQQMDIERLVSILGAFGEQLYKIAKEDVKYEQTRNNR
jgi:hypothetical protein